MNAVKQAALEKEAAHKHQIEEIAIGESEKKWQSQEKSYTDEIERLVSELRGRDQRIGNMNDQIIDLQRKQFHPRMERLKIIEKDIKDRMEEYALAEERMEVKKTTNTISLYKRLY